ncbi:hypothetical protein Q5752_000796 [Cryptotrichosporon argae]
MASRTVSADFYVRFQRVKDEIVAALLTDAAATAAAPKLARLKAELGSVLAHLPPYDQRTYDAQLQELERRVAAARPAGRKFAFKKSAAQPMPASLPVAPSSPAPTTPVPTSEIGSTAAPSSDYTISSRFSAKLTTSALAPRGTFTLTLSSLSGCVVDLRPDGGLTALHAQDVVNTAIVGPKVGGSVMLSGLRRCVVVIGAQQFRMHACHDCAVLLDVASIPVIEASTCIQIGAHPSGSEGSKHALVQDFDWVQPGRSPHWSLLHPDEVERLHAALDRGDLASLRM